ncbi:enoyl-CoA hydratase/isomerase family protein [Aquimarina sp. U1-2]|uniref:crotonase/enoyl-CoA hydratase family protein n=1 Tax=Aquimarina sp. U1-2 TaxID=2823141 RepID=UPI001AECE89E|nr:crotonase/enoyl-CoA hydratase family protein [Aquimarina sp. U1-2]MBP2831636.1 enoyl-CoA hydratase/isomerase family protein [Aquimarina sp. U1-2]
MRQFNYISMSYIQEEELLLWKIKDTGMPNFCLQGLLEFQEFCDWVKTYFSHPDRPLKFIVSGSEHQGIYNMGGDLSFFLHCIRSKDIEQLITYANLCIDAIYAIHSSFDLPVITIALVEGNAYGGGFECALAHDYILAAEDVQFCLPENKFNLFPGMGAHSLLTRKVSPSEVNKLIRSDTMYSAKNLETIGLVEKIIEPKMAMQSLYQYIAKIKERFNFELHHIQCKKMVNAISKEELLAITNLWVEACMKVASFDLRRMEILAKAQSRIARVAI